MIAPDGSSGSRIYSETFLSWLNSPLECTAASLSYDDHIIRDTQLWIKPETEIHAVDRCIKQELFKSFGVGRLENPGLIVNGVYQNDQTDYITDMDVATLLVLYSELVTVGQDAVKTDEVFRMIWSGE